MKFDIETLATAVFGLFATVGSLIFMVAKNKTDLLGLFKKKKRAPHISTHFIFFEIQSWLEYQIDFKCSNVRCPIRSALAKKFLHLRFEMKGQRTLLHLKSI